ncbi:MAG: hypothetical protein AAGI71_14915 [Bacteroidota bacterium]
MPRLLGSLLGLALLITGPGCDAGLAPPDANAFGAIRGVVTYGPLEAWPPADSLQDLRFVAMRFIPRDTSDFLQLNRLVFSPGLDRNVAQDTFLIADVPTGVYVYSGVAQQYSRDLFAWRPLGLYTDTDGLFEVQSAETTVVQLTVNFRSLPPFPPGSTPRP